MLHFHVNVFGQPFAITWEQAAESLEALPRMIFEPDGSWVWSGGAGETRWQIDGHLFDFEDRLHRVELRGECPEEAFNQMLACFGWPRAELTFEQVLEGVTLDEKAFRRAAVFSTG
ncbi:MAG: hypothetical protein GXP28_10675 [Planctomycetes bacterium]|nr:hypothetical protein [Planctomycetota bacterium]